MVGDILQPTHLLFVLVVALLVLGPKRLPEVGRTLGNGIRDFRAAINGETVESRDEIDEKPWQPAAEPAPEEKHEFAHEGETTPDSHEFAHEDTGVSAAAAQTEPATGSEATSARPASPGVAGPASEKHEFAHEPSDPAEDTAGNRT